MTQSRAALALQAFRLLAVDPVGLGGVWLRGGAGPMRDALIAALRTMAPDAPWRRLTPGMEDAALLGGLDVAATLATGRPIARSGLLAGADGGFVEALSAERLAPERAGLIGCALRDGGVHMERDGLSAWTPTRFALLLCDEGIEPDEAAPLSLVRMVAFEVEVEGMRPRDLADAVDWGEADPAAEIAAARARLAGFGPVPEQIVRALTEAAAALGIADAEAVLRALRAARASAALANRAEIAEEDLSLAAILTLAPRAIAAPPPSEEAPDPAPSPPDPAPDETPPSEAQNEQAPQIPAEILLDAVRAEFPEAALAALIEANAQRNRRAARGQSAASKIVQTRGRPLAARPARRLSGGRIAVLDTLRAAAPWQTLRRQGAAAADPRPILLRAGDLHAKRFRQAIGETTILAVDASGSQAFRRLAEAKGAVELVLARAYVARAEAGLVAFRLDRAELALPPTRALARARRALADLVGGGPTPLCAGIRLALRTALAAQKRGRVARLVFLTDGGANIAADGRADRAAAMADALAAAAQVKASGLAALVVDTAPRPQPAARALAEAMGATYAPLPGRDSKALAAALGA